MRIIYVNTLYDEFAADVYRAHPRLDRAGFAEQMAFMDSTFFPSGGAWSAAFRSLGHETMDIDANNGAAQVRWCVENGAEELLHTCAEEHRFGFYRWPRRQPRPWYLPIVARQVRTFRPDILILANLYTFDSQFLDEIRGHAGLIVGQHAAALPSSDLRGYDLIVSSLPNQVEHFRSLGLRSELQRLAFDRRMLVALGPPRERHHAGFHGQVSSYHTARIGLLRRVAEAVELEMWGGGDWGREGPPAGLRRHPALWGIDLYRKMAETDIVLNCHLDAAGPYANNLRLYEATGVGSFLLTDWKFNLHGLFEIGTEVAAYRDADDAVRLLQHYREHPEERRAIAEAGQRRTLRDHTYEHRAAELIDMLGALFPGRL